jgi:hypothetical protein
MDDQIIVKYVKIDGQSFENPLPKFEYDGKIGTWLIVIGAEKYADVFTARHAQHVEVEVGMQLGILLDVGKEKSWRSNLPDMPAFVAKIKGSDPMHFAER